MTNLVFHQHLFQNIYRNIIPVAYHTVVWSGDATNSVIMYNVPFRWLADSGQIMLKYVDSVKFGLARLH
jgi:hypothetical protein